MEKSDKPELVLLLTALFETFGGTATKAKLMGYWMGLEDLPLEAVRQAVGRSVQECDFLPKPAELRTLAGVERPHDAALLAWADVQKNVHVGPYVYAVTFADPIANAVIRNIWGTWICCCDRFAEGESQEKFMRIDFVKVYQSLARQPITDMDKAPLGALGTEISEPKVLGKPRHTQQVGHQPLVEAAPARLPLLRLKSPVGG